MHKTNFLYHGSNEKRDFKAKRSVRDRKRKNRSAERFLLVLKILFCEIARIAYQHSAVDAVCHAEPVHNGVNVLLHNDFDGHFRYALRDIFAANLRFFQLGNAAADFRLNFGIKANDHEINLLSAAKLENHKEQKRNNNRGKKGE